MIATIKPLNQRSDLNLTNLPNISREAEMLAAFFLTRRREVTKAQSFLFYASFEGKMIATT
jgi:hypothetical protein